MSAAGRTAPAGRSPLRRRVEHMAAAGVVVSTPLHMAGISIVLVSMGMIVSGLVGAITDGQQVVAIVGAGAATGVAGLMVWRFTSLPGEVSHTSALATVAWSWVAVSVAGSVPFLTTHAFDTPLDALFESVSGFTCSGSTLFDSSGLDGMKGLDELPKGLLFWRQMTQWFGGMGMVVLAVAVLPLLGVGGLELISAEAPGEGADKLAPRVSETAKRLWTVYGVITVLTTISLMVVGMNLFDAVAHAFTAVSTGGFSPFPNSIGDQSLGVEIVLEWWMVISAMNFNLHWFFLGERHFRPYRESWELRIFLKALLVGVILVTLFNTRSGMPFPTALRDSAFNVITLGTSTGYGTANFVTWSAAPQLVLFMFMITGAMTGSTSGGIKMLRVAVLAKHAFRGIRLARQPHAVLPIRRYGESIPESVVSRMAGFVLLYFLLALVGALLIVVIGLGPTVNSNAIVTSVGASVSALGNMGPGFGAAGPADSFAVFNPAGRVLVMVLMLIGRLEVFPVLLMFAAMTKSLRRRA